MIFFLFVEFDGNFYFFLNFSIPRDKENGFKGCRMYDKNYSDKSFWNEVPGKEVYCREGWLYDKSKYESTVVTEVSEIIFLKFLVAKKGDFTPL